MIRTPLRCRLAALPPSRLMLFLDFDGTLVPIVHRPDDAKLAPGVRHILQRLARSLPVVIISGRNLADLRRKVGVRGLHYVGHHGLVYGQPSRPLQWSGPRLSRKVVKELSAQLRTATDGIRGAFVEDKELSVAIHDRLVQRSERHLLHRRTIETIAPWVNRRAVRLIRGKRVLEVMGAGLWNKGVAVAAILRQPRARGLAFFFLAHDPVPAKGRSTAAAIYASHFGGRTAHLPLRDSNRVVWYDPPASENSERAAYFVCAVRMTGGSVLFE